MRTIPWVSHPLRRARLYFWLGAKDGINISVHPQKHHQPTSLKSTTTNFSSVNRVCRQISDAHRALSRRRPADQGPSTGRKILWAVIIQLPEPSNSGEYATNASGVLLKWLGQGTC